MSDLSVIFDASNLLSFCLGLVIGYVLGRLHITIDKAAHDAKVAMNEARTAKRIADALLQDKPDA